MADRQARPTIVLEHGAFADGSSWNGVIERLHADGYSVVAAANPLRGPHSDAVALRGVLDHVKGPKILVGHSYKPTWDIVTTQDLNIPASVQRFTARRAHAHTIDVAASRSVAVSHPASSQMSSRRRHRPCGEAISADGAASARSARTPVELLDPQSALHDAVLRHMRCVP